MTPQRHPLKQTIHRALHRAGILFERRQLWISEYGSITFVATIIVSIGLMIGLILHNEQTLHRQGATTVMLNSTVAQLTQQVAQEREKNRIVEAMQVLISRPMSPRVLGNMLDIVYSSSSTYGYEPLLVLAVIKTESVFNQQAQGRFISGRLSGALGLMQIKYETAREMASGVGLTLSCEADLLKPEINIALGIAYLTQMITKFKSFKLGLLAYNQGPGAVYEGLKGSNLSIGYYEKVLRNYTELCTIVDRNVLSITR